MHYASPARANKILWGGKMYNINLFEELLLAPKKKASYKNKFKQWSQHIIDIERKMNKNIVDFDEKDFIDLFDEEVNAKKSRLFNSGNTFDNFKTTIKDYYKESEIRPKAFNKAISAKKEDISYCIEMNELTTLYNRKWLYSLKEKILTTRDLVIVFLLYEGVGGTPKNSLTYEEVQYIRNDNLKEGNLLEVYRESKNFTRYIKVPKTSFELFEKAKDDLVLYEKNELSGYTDGTLKQSVYLVKSNKENSVVTRDNINSLLLNRVKSYLKVDDFSQSLIQKSGIIDYCGLIDFYGKLDVNNIANILFRYGIRCSPDVCKRYYDYYKKACYYQKKYIEENRIYYDTSEFKEIYEHIASYKLPHSDIFKVNKKTYNTDETFLDVSYTEQFKTCFNIHREIDRDPNLISQIKKDFLKKHRKLFCEICMTNFELMYGEVGKEYIEIHHLIPLGYLKQLIDEGKDIEYIKQQQEYLMVCSNCHSMFHRNRHWYNNQNIETVKDLRKSNNLSIETVFKNVIFNR